MLLKAFVVWVGVQLGAGIYEAQIVIPQWSSVAPEEVGGAIERSGFKSGGLRFWAFVSPPVALLAIANVFAAWRAPSRARPWWLAAAVTMVLESVATYGYFVPAAFRLFEAETLPSSEVQALVSQWVGLNPVRLIVGLAALMSALQALSLLGARHPALGSRDEPGRWPGPGRQAASARTSAVRGS